LRSLDGNHEVAAINEHAAKLNAEMSDALLFQTSAELEGLQVALNLTAEKSRKGARG
jgi:hypothetical protein